MTQPMDDLMHRDKIIDMAREADLDWHRHWDDEENRLERFAKLVRKDYSFTHAQLWIKRFYDAIKAENEACARMVEPLDESLADAIRERLQGIQSEHCDCPGFCTGACEANR